ncbi:MAG TPA: molybdate ABC transporter substrate-binding protein [Phycisphaerae bacterium]|nr:molybdate ABC transporter substrate-binding protein [Phycisphaerae bacterium]HRW52487.1 molybdate ABC transporter substrate-binding protein [Phycisphaerae bacterium]
MNVLAAASVADLVEAIGVRYQSERGVTIRISRGASGVLCRQIENGAACDVFLPAHPAYIERLGRSTRVSIGRPCAIAGNRLALITRRGWMEPDTVGPEGTGDPGSRIVRILTQANRVAIANVDHAPAGRYARRVLDAVGPIAGLGEKLVYGDDVRMTAQYVAEGVVDCGFVYQSDAQAFADRIGSVIAIPPGLHSPIVYEACVVGDSDEAAAFIAYLASEAAAPIWREHGFAAAPVTTSSRQ